MNVVRVAVVQAAPVAFDLDRTLEKAPRPGLSEAAGRGGRLIVFPEAFVGGYPRGLDFGARSGHGLPRDATCSAATGRARSMSRGRPRRHWRHGPAGACTFS